MPAPSPAITPSNVLVLYNTASADGAAIAAHYSQVYPGVQLLGLTGVPAGDEITADQYLQQIRPQVLPALTPSIDVIVTTKGLPVRINTTERFASFPATYVDPFNVSHTVYASSWKPYSSLESELTRVDSVSTWEQMLDQTFWHPTNPPAAANPYYNRGVAFSYTDPANGGIRLASRLDGYNAADVNAAVDRAQNVIAGPYHFVVDDDPSKTYASGMDTLVNTVLAPANQPFTYDNTSAFVGTAPGPVLGYVSHGANQASTPPNYILDSTNGLQFPLAKGAVMETWESFNAYSFDAGGNVAGQGLVADWINRGGTAGVGNVQEPTASLSTVTNEAIMFNMLLQGYTFAEAAWTATRQLSWVNTVVGDPLMTWKPALPGDVDGDGLVGASDLAILSKNWGATGPGGGAMWGLGDVDGDGRVGASDFALFSANWGRVATWAGGGASLGQGFGGLDETLLPVPEPSSLCLSVAAAISSLMLRSRSRRR
ncbi:MAG: TIGR03790 family protein [Planctomycetia bacterium]|nr:TIGR03790 family protein [Planctomycetia bacterium]